MDVQGVLEVLEQSCAAGSQQRYLSAFSQTINKVLGLSGSVCFKMNPMKDHLILASSTFSIPDKTSISFSLKNTENPIIYSLVANKPYIVHSPNILTGIEVNYLQMIKAAPEGDAVFCYPFNYGSTIREHGVFVFFARPDVIKHLHKDDSYQRLLNIFAAMLGIFELAEVKDKERQIMKTDLTKLSIDKLQKTVKEQISRQYIGHSPASNAVCDLVVRAASSDVAVLLNGETGVGKDLAASLIHQYSKRSAERFMVVNCAAIPEHLLESELFGYCKGAFTGANQHKQGLIKQADGGTLFLDEIGDLSETLQAKLLRVLQEKRFTPVGASKEEYSDFRLITATHRPLKEWIETQRFRRDLFYRINQFEIAIPALRDRMEDIPALVEYFTNRYIQENTVHITGYEDSAMELLQSYHYPGNIRELKNIVFQACMFVGSDSLITHDNIHARLESMASVKPIREEEDKPAITLESGQSLPEAKELFERNMIRMALKKSGGSRSRAADTLGIPKRTLAHKCKKWSICDAS